MSNQLFNQAKFSQDCKYIIDSNGNRVEFTDPRVTFIWTIDSSPYVSRLMSSFFKKRGWKLRISGETNRSTLEYAKMISSGRECIAFKSIAGSIFKDLFEKRKEGEISVYYNHDQQGPCQNGAWPDIWGIFQTKIRLNDVILFSNFNYSNNYWGQGDELGNELMSAIVIGDIFDEAENVLRCISKDKDTALEIFNKEAEKVIDSARIGLKNVLKALKKWAKAMRDIPLSIKIEKSPKVLIFGGLNTRFVHKPVTDFFIENGIIPKIIEFSEITTANEAERFLRYGFKKGRVHPREFFSYWRLLLDFLNPTSNFKELKSAMKSRINVTSIDILTRLIRNYAKKSGLIFDKHIPFKKIVLKGHEYITSISFAETILIAGRYAISVEDGNFDGFIQIGVFGCPPTINAHTILRPIANKNDIPYAAIDMEGPWISANQTLLLETVAVGARRERQQKSN